jgi:hypothetical protein
VNIKPIRDRAWLYLNPGVAACAGMTLQELQQFIAGSFHPSEDQLAALARRMGMETR